MIPRGTPDIGWGDLAWSLVDCLRWSNREATQLEVESLWSANNDALACLSIRSGFDLLLQVLAWPAGSEVLVSAITIPDMLAILAAHNLVAVPLDLDPATLAFDAEQIRQLAGPRTKGVLIAHLFGSRMQLAEINRVAKELRLFVIEDCAQAFDGSNFRGHPDSDVTMFSFGPIKTQTALGGGLLIVRDGLIQAAMRELAAAYPQRPVLSFVKRLLLFSALKLLARLALLTLFVGLCNGFCWDYDAVLNRLVRGFYHRPLIPQLRQRPCTAQLRLLTRRLQNFHNDWIQRRQEIANHVASELREIMPGNGAAYHAHWVLPIVAEDGVRLTRQLVNAGFDATRKASSMVAVPTPADRPESDPTNAREMIERLVYLPMHPALRRDKVVKLCALIRDYGSAENRQSEAR